VRITSRKRLFKLLGALLVFILLGVVWQILHPHRAEPIYQGKPESFWINSLGGRYSESLVSDLGSNMVPVLLKAVAKRGDGMPKSYQTLWQKLPTWAQRRIPQPVNPAAVRSNAMLILVQGEYADAKTLISLLKNNHDPVVRKIAANGLFINSTDAVTVALIQAVNDPDPQVRLAVVIALSLTERAETLVVPACIECQKSTDPKVRFWTACAMSAYPSGEQAAIPELVEALKDKDPSIHNMAIMMLKDIAPDELVKAGIKF
jgi:HEAT repeat protein